MAGRITHAGFVSFIDNPVPLEDAHVIRLLRQAGAVIHVRTNQPQSLMVYALLSFRHAEPKSTMTNCSQAP